MTEAILVSLITGSLSLAGVVVTNLTTFRKSRAAAQVAQAITDTKLEELTREVREHNHFAKRMPVVEHELNTLRHRITVLEGRNV